MGDMSLAPIEDVEVGQRVYSHSGCAAPTEVDGTWRVARLEFAHGGSRSSERTMLSIARPQSWFESRGLRHAGDAVFLDEEVLGASGEALMLSLEPMPPVDEGDGCVVVTTSRSLVDERVQLELDSRGERLEATPEHPIFSPSRGGWVAAAELRHGDAVQVADGLAFVSNTRSVRGRAEVYNLEVEYSHEYAVTNEGVRVHNNCWLDKAVWAMGRLHRDEIPARLWRIAGGSLHGHHIIPKGLSRGANGRLASQLRTLARRWGMEDIANDTRNLVPAPYSYVHSEAGLQRVYDALKESRSRRDFFSRLEELRQQMWDGSFYDGIEL